MFRFLYEVQLAIRGSLTGAIDGFAQTRDWGVLLAMMPLGIVFGAAHAMTPGHSKSILATYVLGSGLIPYRAVLTSLILAATHITSAVLLAVIANTLVTRTLVGAGRAPALENLSRYMLVAIGLWLVLRAWRSRPHVHGEGYMAGFIAGLVPCPLILFVMTLAVSRGGSGSRACVCRGNVPRRSGRPRLDCRHDGFRPRLGGRLDGTARRTSVNGQPLARRPRRPGADRHRAQRACPLTNSQFCRKAPFNPLLRKEGS